MTLEEFCKDVGITCEVVRDSGAQVEDGWEHHAYVLSLRLEGRTFETPWKQGYGIETSPTDVPWEVLGSLLSDAEFGTYSFEEFCDLGYDEDSRRAYAQWEQCQQIATELPTFLGQCWSGAVSAHELGDQ